MAGRLSPAGAWYIVKSVWVGGGLVLEEIPRQCLERELRLVPHAAQVPRERDVGTRGSLWWGREAAFLDSASRLLPR